MNFSLLPSPATIRLAPTILFTRRHGLLLSGLLLLTGLVTQAQVPTITGVSPTRNLRNAPITTNVAITFSQPMSTTATTLSALKVFSQQRGGRMQNGARGVTTVSGSTLTFNPTTNFKPGETVYTTVTPSAQSSSGTPLAKGQVSQFITAVGGTGRGNFTPPTTNPNPTVGSGPTSVAMGDVDGDGDLDFLTANNSSANVSVRLNDGAGHFTPPATNPETAVGNNPRSVAMGDVDGDGDLDFIAANFDGSTVSVRLNDGAGHFTPPATNPNPAVGSRPISMALGDVDGDGDLDLLAANQTSNTVSVRLNDGAGHFTPPATNPNPAVGSGPTSVALGDVDGDGDLDLLTANLTDNTVSVRLNDGAGHFTPPATNPNPTVGTRPFSVAVGDVDGDGDLDFIAANAIDNTVSVRLNDGAGHFTPPATNPNPAVDTRPWSVALGDVDGDGDLDFIAANSNAGSATVSVRLNDGAGHFTPPPTNPEPAVEAFPVSVALGDVDGDGDLDFIAANSGSTTVSVRLNQPVPPTITGFNPVDNTVCVGSPITFTATVGQVTGAYNFTLSNGTSSTASTATSTAFSQTLTASGNGPQSFTLTVADNGFQTTATTSLTVNALPVFTVNPTSVTLTNASPTASLSATGSGTLLWSTGQTSPVISVTASGLYSVTLTNAGGCSTSATAAVFGADLTVNLVLPQANFGTSGTAAIGNFVVNVFEVGGLPTSSGTVRITITAPVGYTLSFPAALTSITVSGGSLTPVNNGQWTVSQNLTNRQLTLIMTSGAFIGAGGESSLGFSITRTTANSGSTANITVNVGDDLTMTYDGNLSNNVYARIISGL